MTRIFRPCAEGQHHACAVTVVQSGEWVEGADHLVSVECGCVCHAAKKVAAGNEEVAHAR